MLGDTTVDVLSALLLQPSLVEFYFFFSSRRRHTRLTCDWSSDVCSSDLLLAWIGGGLLIYRLVDRLLVRGRGALARVLRSEERRVGKECRSRGAPYHLKKKKEKMRVRGMRDRV